jgi:hypothetical protein
VCLTACAPQSFEMDVIVGSSGSAAVAVAGGAEGNLS